MDADFNDIIRLLECEDGEEGELKLQLLSEWDSDADSQPLPVPAPPAHLEDCHKLLQLMLQESKIGPAVNLAEVERMNGKNFSSVN